MPPAVVVVGFSKPRQVSTVRSSMPLQFTMGEQPSKTVSKLHLPSATNTVGYIISLYQTVTRSCSEDNHLGHLKVRPPCSFARPACGFSLKSLHFATPIRPPTEEPSLHRGTGSARAVGSRSDPLRLLASHSPPKYCSTPGRWLGGWTVFPWICGAEMDMGSVFACEKKRKQSGR